MRRREVESADDASDVCSVRGCDGAVKRSVPLKRVTAALPSLRLDDSGRRVKLCRDHYREFKKATREARALDRLGR